jgi:D-alanine-D-alanine ligase
MRIVIIYNQPVLPDDDPEAESEKWVATAVTSVFEALVASGHEVTTLAVGRTRSSLEVDLGKIAPDVVFNLFEGFADQPASEAAVVRLLERWNVPFTGSSSRTLRRCLNKHQTKRRLIAAGLPTPWSIAVDRFPIPSMTLPWPVIVKPAARDASEGIDQCSVATSSAALESQVTKVLRRYGPPVLIEQFLAGREFTVSLIETPRLTALSIAEVLFIPCETAVWPLLTYEAKWIPDSADYAATDMLHAPPLEPELSEIVVSLAKRAYRSLACRDYARIDIRLNAAGQPMILDVNPNPDMSPTACFAYALKAAGIERSEFIVSLAEQASARAYDWNTKLTPVPPPPNNGARSTSSRASS